MGETRFYTCKYCGHKFEYTFGTGMMEYESDVRIKERLAERALLRGAYGDEIRNEMLHNDYKVFCDIGVMRFCDECRRQVVGDKTVVFFGDKEVEIKVKCKECGKEMISEDERLKQGNLNVYCPNCKRETQTSEMFPYTSLFFD